MRKYIRVECKHEGEKELLEEMCRLLKQTGTKQRLKTSQYMSKMEGKAAAWLKQVSKKLKNKTNFPPQTTNRKHPLKRLRSIPL